MSRQQWPYSTDTLNPSERGTFIENNESAPRYYFLFTSIFCPFFSFWSLQHLQNLFFKFVKFDKPIPLTFVYIMQWSVRTRVTVLRLFLSIFKRLPAYITKRYVIGKARKRPTDNLVPPTISIVEFIMVLDSKENYFWMVIVKDSLLRLTHVQ